MEKNPTPSHHFVAMPTIKLQSPGRICFFGDHQDYLGLPVIAGTIDRYLYLEAEPIDEMRFTIHLLDLEETHQLSLRPKDTLAPPAHYFEAGMQYFWKQGAIFPHGYSIRIWSEIPINAGLSSSSALVVCWLRFLAQVQKGLPIPDPVTLGKWAFAVEVEAFNQPGGIMDQYTIAQGGWLYIDTDSQQSETLPDPKFHWIVAESGMEKKTLKMLQTARDNQQKAIAIIQQQQPQFRLLDSQLSDEKRFQSLLPKALQSYWHASLHNYAITREAKRLLQNNPTPKELGTLLNAHQHILAHHIQNTPPLLGKMMEAAKKAGAWGAKIVGSGGGGCMVALVPKAHQNAVIDAFIQNGAVKAYPVTITPLHEHH